MMEKIAVQRTIAKEELAPIFHELFAEEVANYKNKENGGPLFDVSMRDLFERVIVVEEEIKNLIRMMDRRFEQVDKRFEQVDKRFERMETRLDKRFEQVDKRFEQVDKRFEQVDKRFEQVDKRFEQMQSSMDKRFEQMQSSMDKRFDHVYRFMQWQTGIGFAMLVGIYIKLFFG